MPSKLMKFADELIKASGEDRREKVDDIKMWFLAKKRARGTESLVELFLEENNVYTLREDEREEIWIYKEGIYIPQGKTYIKEFVRDIMGEGYTTHLANQVIEKIETDTYIESDIFFKQATENINEIPLKNGLLELSTRTLNKFSPDKIFLNKIPLSYHKESHPEDILKFIKEVVQEEDIPLIQEIFGFTLFKKYNIQKAIMFLGDGANGKSRLLELLKIFVGDDNCSNVTLGDLENDEWAPAYLFGKMVNISGDISSKTLKNTDLFKVITSGCDTLQANRKFKNPIRFVNYAKFINACNKLPLPKQLDKAFFRRWILIKFLNEFKPANEITEEDKSNHYIKVADENILLKITSPGELSGLLNWALDGLDRLLHHGFSNSKTTQSLQQEWVRDANSFMAFAEDNIICDYNQSISKDSLRQKYSEYCRNHKIKVVPDWLLKKTLEEDLGAWETRSSDFTRIRLWCGINWKETKKETPKESTILDAFPKKGSCKISHLFEQKNLDPIKVESEIIRLKRDGIIAEIKPGEFERL